MMTLNEALTIALAEHSELDADWMHVAIKVRAEAAIRAVTMVTGFSVFGSGLVVLARRIVTRAAADFKAGILERAVGAPT